MASLVIKRDGTTEPFDPEKITRVLLAAGLETDSAALVTANISAWIKNQPEPVSSLAIRDRVLLELEKVDPYIAGLFHWYQKTKDSSVDV